MLTKKDFVELAGMIKNKKEAVKREWGKESAMPDAMALLAVSAVVVEFGRDLASFCAAENPRFDRARFLAACGLEGA